MFWDWMQNFVKPGVALGGSLVLWLMNRGHRSIQSFACRFFQLPLEGQVLDIGCGGGAFIASMSKSAPKVKFFGVDYSPLAVKRATAYNQKLVNDGLATFCVGSVDKLPFPDASFQVVTACETLYFWPDPSLGVREAARVLAPQGKLVICCDSSDKEKAKKYTDKIKGMVVYTPEEIKGFMQGAQLVDITIHFDSASGALCVIGSKTANNLD